MSLVYSQDWESYSVGLDIDPNVPNWVWSPQTLNPNSFKINSGFGGKYGRLLPFGGEWGTASYNVIFSSSYFEISARVGSSTPFIDVHVREQAPGVFPGSYMFRCIGGFWAIQWQVPGGGGPTGASGSMPIYNPGDFEVTVIMIGSIMSVFIDGLPLAGAIFDFAAFGNPYPTGRFAFGILSNDGAVDDITVYDAPPPPPVPPFYPTEEPAFGGACTPPTIERDLKKIGPLAMRINMDHRKRKFLGN